MRRRDFLSSASAAVALTAAPAFGVESSSLVAEVPEGIWQIRGSVPHRVGNMVIGYCTGRKDEVVVFLARVCSRVWPEVWSYEPGVKEFRKWLKNMGDSETVRQTFVLNSENWRRGFLEVCRDMGAKIQYRREMV